ncbi:MAG: AmmeMemoRadiSam system protein A, partial [Proteobacteria bacterium]|nr:AmmeMemoRadiSam system protein A [Pseudomonadota bacterium]
LLEDVKHNANAAAFHDTRFSPLRLEELDITEIEISLLSAMQALHFSSEQEALMQLRPGVDGVVFEFAQHRSTFLPQVWQQLPDTGDFIAHLKTKAGLPADFWADDVRLSNYTVSKWKERDFVVPLEDQTT